MIKTKLKAARLEVNKSQSDVAKEVGMSLRTLQDYEQDRKPLRKAAAETVVKLAHAVGKTVEEII